MRFSATLVVLLGLLTCCLSTTAAKAAKKDRVYQKGKLVDIKEENLSPRVTGAGNVVVSKNQTTVSYIVELDSIVYVGERIERGKDVAAPAD